ncbi:hypothetical protein ACKWTF_015536 [Chironomus riparius]
MDLERAIFFRELIIRSDDHLRETYSSTANKIIEELVTEVKNSSNLNLEINNRTQKGSRIRSTNQKTDQKLSKSSAKNDRIEQDCTINLQSIVKLEQLEADCVNSDKQLSLDKGSIDENSVSPSQYSDYDQNSKTNNRKISKTRQKTTIMHPNQANLDENPSTLDENPSTLDENPSTLDENPSTLDENPSNFNENQSDQDNAVQFSIKLEPIDQNYEKSSPQKLNGLSNLLKDLKTTAQLSQLSEDFHNDSNSGDHSSNNAEENSDLFQTLDNSYPNLEDITTDVTPYIPSSIKQNQNHIEVSRKKSKRRKTVPDCSYQNLDSDEIKCDICFKTFSKRCYMTQHFQTVHMPFTPHKCSKCGKKYANIEELNLHVLKHIADKPFKCPYCPKAFNHKSDLKRHKISHAGKKPFQCTMCSRGFVRNDHLLKHIRVHQRKNEKTSNTNVKYFKVLHKEVLGC